MLLLILLTALPSSAEFRVCASSQQITSFTGTHKVKVLFVAGNNLHMVDFSQATPHVSPLMGTSGAIIPAISPDGQWVAYATGPANDGVARSSTVWVRGLKSGAVPRLVTADSAFHPRFIPGATPSVLVYASDGYSANAWNGHGRMYTRTIGQDTIGPEQVLFAEGSFYGGVSADRRYLAHAQSSRNAFMIDMQDASGEIAALHRLRLVDNKGRDSLYNLQVCNPSISTSPQYPDMMLYIDFGTPPNLSSAQWGEWGFHERIFLSGYDGEVRRVYDVPAEIGVANPMTAVHGEIVDKNFDDPEWTTHPRFAVANVEIDRLVKEGGQWEHLKRHEAVYLIDLFDSSMLRVLEVADTSVSGTGNMLWPVAWIDRRSAMEEPDGWLASEAGSRPHSHDLRPGERISFERGVITTASRINGCALRTLSGRKVPDGVSVLHSGTRARINRRCLSRGVYILELSTLSQTKTILPIIIPR
jgi:hypothetical protein